MSRRPSRSRAAREPAARRALAPPLPPRGASTPRRWMSRRSRSGGADALRHRRPPAPRRTPARPPPCSRSVVAFIEIPSRPRVPLEQAGHHGFFERAGRRQMERVHPARLPEPIDASDALLQPVRAPGPFERDDHAGPSLQVQALAGDVRRQQHRGVSVEKPAEQAAAFHGVETAVQHHDRGHRLHVGQAGFDRVAELAEHDDGLAKPREQPSEPEELRRCGRGVVGERDKGSQAFAFVRAAEQAGCRQPSGLHLVYAVTFVQFLPRQRWLRVTAGATPARASSRRRSVRAAAHALDVARRASTLATSCDASLRAERPTEQGAAVRRRARPAAAAPRVWASPAARGWRVTW